MPLRPFMAGLMIATALPAVAVADAPTETAAPEIIWVDSFDDIPNPRPQACIGNISAMYCHAEDGRTYGVPVGRGGTINPSPIMVNPYPFDPRLQIGLAAEVHNVEPVGNLPVLIGQDLPDIPFGARRNQ